jgi:hypothetical protein
MSAVAASFISPFPGTGPLGLSITSIAGGPASGANAASIIAAGAIDSSSPFSILSANSATTTSSPTIAALTTGELSTEDHTVIAAIGGTANNSLVVPYNANGTAPTTITALQALGWIKIDGVLVPPGSNVPTSATYSLTPVGQAIYKRTVATTLGPGTQATIANAAAASPATASAIDSGLAAQVSTLVGALSSVGVDVQV